MATAWAARAWDPQEWAPVSWNEPSEGAEPETLAVTMAPASFVTDEAAARDGVAGGTLTGAWWVIPGKAGVPDRYVWYSHDGQGLDPGLDEDALAGLEGIEVQLAAGNRTAAQVATSTAAAIDAHDDYTAVADGDNVEVTGLIAAAGFTTGGAWADRGGGGVIGCTDVSPLGDFAVTTGAVSQLSPAALPPAGTRFRVHGFQIYWGTVHTGQIAVAVYQGNTAADGTSEGATLVKHMGVTTGTATGQWVTVLLAPADTFTMDATDGRIFVARAGDSGSRHGAENLGTQVSARSWTYWHLGVSTWNGSWALAASGNITGSGATFPATLPAQGTANSFVPAIRLLYTVEPWVGSGEWRARVGTRSSAATFTSDVAIDFFVGLSYALPNVIGMELASIGAALSVHTTTGQPRVEAWAGGDASNDYTNATLLHSTAQMTGTATGWLDFEVPAGAAAAASSRLWLTIKGLNSTSEILYSASGPAEYSPDLDPAGYLNLSSETENPEGQGISTDGASPTASPLEPTTPPTNPPNYPALRGEMRVPGFALAA